MCGWSPIRDAIESVASVAGNYLLPGSSLVTDNLVSKGAQKNLNSPLGQIAQVGSGIAGGGGFGQGLQSGGGSLEQQGLSSLYNGASDALGNFADSTGLSGIGNDISTGWGNFTNASGLSDFLGGNSAPSQSLTDSYNAIYGSPGSVDIAGAAATPSAGGITGALPSSGSIGAAGGGNLGGFGTGLGSDFTSGLSSTSLGTTGQTLGNVAGNDFSAFNSSAPSLASTPISNLDIGGISSATQNPGGYFNGSSTSALDSLSSPVPASEVGQGFLGVGTPSQLATANTNANTLNLAGANASLPGAATGNILDTSSLGGKNVGILGSLFGGGQGAGGGQSAGNSIVNSLARGGLGYLFNQPNTSGANAINAASQQAQQNFQPYLAAGQGAENTLANLYGTNGQAAQTSAQQNFANTPGYQFALNQGINAVNADAAAKGSPLSGNNQLAINNYAQGTANQTYNNYVNQLQNLASGGMSAAGGASTAGLTGAAALSQLGQNKANAANTAIGTGLQGLFPSNNLDWSQLFGGGGNNAGLLSLFGAR